jgi:hypothetical protein
MKKLKIEIEEWSHTCGDGCCYTYGTDIFINGKKVSSGDYNNTEIILKEVLESLNFDVEI